MNLLLGAGKDRKNGWVSVDQLAHLKPDVTCNLTTAPWPWADNSTDKIEADNLLEHIGWSPAGEDLLMVFMNEAHRVIKPSGTLWIRVPDFKSWPEGALKDPTHRRYFVTGTFNYWDVDHQTYKVYGSSYGYKPWRVKLISDRRFITVTQQPVK